jgi:acetolactate synthase-1/2/3 large subunit
MGAQLPAIPMAVEQGLPVIFLVMNNRAHGTIADLQASNFGRSYGCEFTPTRTETPYSPDFAAWAVPAVPTGTPSTSRPTWRRRYAPPSNVADRRCWMCRWSTEPVPTPGHWNIKDIYHGVFE